MIMAEWAAKNGSKRVVTLVNDWAPGTESEAAFSNAFTAGGGQVIEKLKVPLANPDFAPFLQRIRDLNPDTAFIYFPGTQASIFAKQFAERGWAIQASRSSDPAITPTMTITTPWAIRCSAASHRAPITPLMT